MDRNEGHHEPLTITREEAAEALQVSTKTIDNMWRRGDLPRPLRLGRSIRFVRTEFFGALQKKRA